ncbi:MAG: TIGR04255 family protein [Alphaproteobacteria bacterium]|nr:hypothetical protein [Hyphomonas sp.]MBR9808681.1 TIGR04255 family protein [Alphaproteobacteria bacterium]|tara:strand:- start:1145 stop:1951 length:807 start_codon:yes stop_codon:yes gene_type:complete
MLKEYSAPPVEKVEMAVYFDPLPQLDLVNLVKVCQSLQKKLGPFSIHQSDYIPTRLEGDGPNLGGAHFEIKQGAPKIGLRLTSEARDRTVLLQDSRLAVSWSRVEQESYPRYPKLKKCFQTVFDAFLSSAGLTESTIGDFKQVGISYVNYLPDDDAKAHELLNFIDFTSFKEHEGIAMQTSQMLQNERIVGRLVLDLMSIFSLDSEENTVRETRKLRMNLTFRGKPAGPGIDGVCNFFDRGHEAIVRTFSDSLSEKGRKKFREQKRDE